MRNKRKRERKTFGISFIINKMTKIKRFYNQTQSIKFKKITIIQMRKKKQQSEENSKHNMQTSNLPNVPEHIMLNNQLSQADQHEVFKIKLYIQLYFNIVKKNICDSVQKVLITFFINSIFSKAQMDIISQVYKADQFEFLLQEDQVKTEIVSQLKLEIANQQEMIDFINQFEKKF
eukprot:TRINITY_DN16962_c0_g1_i1.p1 TRINITY_DN16962_c0_g1~~TRINITY_DN16962_c0_g1_i1.p1  ORF type:complete len:176 (-),score=36.71 TRINITY_DN16962_c0_g1_i1:229-756(-)